MYLPEVDLALWLPRTDETKHTPSDHWLITYNATVNGISFLKFSASTIGGATNNLGSEWYVTASPAEEGPPGFLVT